MSINNSKWWGKIDADKRPGHVGHTKFPRHIPTATVVRLNFRSICYVKFVHQWCSWQKCRRWCRQGLVARNFSRTCNWLGYWTLSIAALDNAGIGFPISTHLHDGLHLRIRLSNYAWKRQNPLGEFILNRNLACSATATYPGSRTSYTLSATSANRERFIRFFEYPRTDNIAKSISATARTPSKRFSSVSWEGRWSLSSRPVTDTANALIKQSFDAWNFPMAGRVSIKLALRFPGRAWK